MGTTTIRLSERSRDRLQDLGKMGETYEDVISRILDNMGVDPNAPCKSCEVYRKKIKSLEEERCKSAGDVDCR